MLIAASKNVSFVSSCEATYCAVKREPKNIEVTMIEAMHTTVDMPVCAFSVSIREKEIEFGFKLFLA
jgi:hypothetical protein